MKPTEKELKELKELKEARLIAAAPEMYEALKRLQGNLNMVNGTLVWTGEEGNFIETDDPRKIIREAIAKAEGK